MHEVCMSGALSQSGRTSFGGNGEMDSHSLELCKWSEYHEVWGLKLKIHLSDSTTRIDKMDINS